MSCEALSQRGHRDLFGVPRDSSEFRGNDSESREFKLEGGGPQTNLAGQDRQPPRRAKSSSPADMRVSMGFLNTFAAVNLAFLADPYPEV